MIFFLFLFNPLAAVNVVLGWMNDIGSKWKAGLKGKIQKSD
jgi:hypothetical protein